EGSWRPSVVLLREPGQLVAHVPELGEELAVREPGEKLDRSALRADDLAADDPLDDADVPEAPRARALVELDQRLGQLVQVLVLARPLVDVRERQAFGAT